MPWLSRQTLGGPLYIAAAAAAADGGSSGEHDPGRLGRPADATRGDGGHGPGPRGLDPLLRHVAGRADGDPRVVGLRRTLRVHPGTRRAAGRGRRPRRARLATRMADHRQPGLGAGDPRARDRRDPGHPDPGPAGPRPLAGRRWRSGASRWPTCRRSTSPAVGAGRDDRSGHLDPRAGRRRPAAPPRGPRLDDTTGPHPLPHARRRPTSRRRRWSTSPWVEGAVAVAQLVGACLFLSVSFALLRDFIVQQEQSDLRPPPPPRGGRGRGA